MTCGDCKIKDKAKKIAAHLLEVGEGDLEWDVDRLSIGRITVQFAEIEARRG